MADAILKWHRFDTIRKARKTLREVAIIYVLTDKDEQILRIGQSSDFWHRFKGGTGWMVDALMHGSGKALYAAEAPADPGLRKDIEAALIFRCKPPFCAQGKSLPPTRVVEVEHQGEVPKGLLENSGEPRSIPEAGCAAKGIMMPRILHFTRSPEDWKALLADPEKHWRTGFSAKTLAHAWEAADGFPPEVAAVFRGSSDPLLQQVEPVLAVPEFKVPLPGGERASQNDLFVLSRCPQGAVAIMVEAKVSESFGPTVAGWLEDASPGKQERLAFLRRSLGLAAVPSSAVRYQLLHRTASAVLEAERFRAVAAVLLVHSFSSQRAGHADYEAFVALFGAPAPIGELVRLGQPNGTPLFAAWVQGDLRFTTA